MCSPGGGLKSGGGKEIVFDNQINNLFNTYMDNTKEVHSATVFFDGDSSVGIPSVSFDLEIFWPNMDDAEGLNSLRDKIKYLYEEMEGDDAKVMFDFEIKEMVEREKQMEEHEMQMQQEEQAYWAEQEAYRNTL